MSGNPAPVFLQPTPFCPRPAQSTDDTLNLLRTHGNLPKTHSIYPHLLNLARDHYNIATTNGSLPTTHSDYVRPTSILVRHRNLPTTHWGLATVNSIYPRPPQFTYDPLTPPKTLVNSPTTQSIKPASYVIPDSKGAESNCQHYQLNFELPSQGSLFFLFPVIHYATVPLSKETQINLGKVYSKTKRGSWSECVT